MNRLRIPLLAMGLVGTAPALAAPAGPPPDRVKQLEALAIFEYPTDSLPRDTSAVEASPLSAGDIADDFSNIDDLTWLEPIARRNKVFIVGEHHYSKGIADLVRRMLFALNTYQHYGLVSLEYPYSEGLILNHFVALPDDDRAERFLAEHAADLNITTEVVGLARAIRRWNASHPAKPIRIASHDIDSDWRGALRRAVVPYLHQVAPGYEIDARKLTLDELARKLPELTRLVAGTRARPAHAFLTRNDVLAVLSNIEARWESGLVNGTDLFYRQKSIVRNLTDPARLGGHLRGGKVMLWVGAHHAATRFVYPKGADFFSEGSYLNHDFPATRGRAYSVLIRPLAYSFPDFARADVSRCMSPLYRSMVERFQAAWHRGLVSPSGYYAFDEEFGTIERLLVARAGQVDHRPIRVQAIDWDRLIGDATGDDRSSLLSWRNDFGHHDAAVVVPRAPLVTALCATPTPIAGGSPPQDK
jgi:hypothetical protein